MVPMTHLESRNQVYFALMFVPKIYNTFMKEHLESSIRQCCFFDVHRTVHVIGM